MGTLALAAKVTHVPSMYLSELPGETYGCRQAAIEGHKEIGHKMRALGVDTVIVFDTHWLVNSGYHINCHQKFKGVYTSNELPHFIRDLEYEFTGNPILGQAIAEKACAKGLRAMAHEIDTLELEYGTILPMRYMNNDAQIKVISIASFCTTHELEDSRILGEAVKEAIAEYDGKVAILASGSFSHRFVWNRVAPEYFNRYAREFDRQVDLRATELWKEGRWAEFLGMMPDYAAACFGEGGMHDNAMLFGALGWDQYKGKAEFITDLFPSSGTGQANAILPIV